LSQRKKRGRASRGTRRQRNNDKKRTLSWTEVEADHDRKKIYRGACNTKKLRGKVKGEGKEPRPKKTSQRKGRQKKTSGDQFGEWR